MMTTLKAKRQRNLFTLISQTVFSQLNASPNPRIYHRLHGASQEPASNDGPPNISSSPLKLKQTSPNFWSKAIETCSIWWIIVQSHCQGLEHRLTTKNKLLFSA